MDPVTQGTLGAALPVAVAPRREAAMAAVLGCLAGMAPDLDVLIRSAEDPLLFLEYHRHFTHALIFIPIGSLLCALVMYGLFARRSLTFGRTLLYCTLGYGTHALLDACTTYGTQLLWPFTDARFAWNTVSVVDPLFTVPLLVLVALGVLRHRPMLARLGLVWAVAYLGLGLVQRDRAVEMGYEIAAARGHTPVRLEAKPSFANIVVWKVVYETDDAYFVDAVRAGIAPKVYPGDRVAKLDVARDFPWLDPASQQALDIERFRWFSNDYVAMDPLHPNRIIDVRYSMIPNQVNALWSIELKPDAADSDHVAYRTDRDANSARVELLWAMISGYGESGSQAGFGGG
jgi:inner membrane protein